MPDSKERDVTNYFTEVIQLMDSEDEIRIQKDEKVGYTVTFKQGDHVNISHIVGTDDLPQKKVEKRLNRFIENIRKRLLAQFHGQDSRGK